MKMINLGTTFLSLGKKHKRVLRCFAALRVCLLSGEGVCTLLNVRSARKVKWLHFGAGIRRYNNMFYADLMMRMSDVISVLFLAPAFRRIP